MNTRLSLILVFFTAGSLSAVRAAPVDSTLSAVTVYADRAVVTRTAKLDLGAAGPFEAVFERLPQGLMDDSLRVGGSGSAKITIIDVTARAEYVDFTPNERVEALENTLRDLQKATRVLDDRVEALNKEQETLEQIAAASMRPSKTEPHLSLDEAEKLLVFLDDWRGKIAAEHRSIDDQRENLESKRKAADGQLAQLRGSGGRSYKNVVVRLSAEGPGSADLTLNYAVPGAGWTPRYDARLSGAANSVQLGYFGVVHQSSGEDWKSVDLTLSTARPSLGGAPPSLREWDLDIFHPAQPTAASGGFGGSGEMMPVTLGEFSVSAAKARGYFTANTTSGTRLANGIGDIPSSISIVDKQQIDASFAQAESEAQATSASFKISNPETVLSDNSPQKVPIGSFQLKAETEYAAVPKLLPAAFLSAKVSNSSDYPFLAGEMNVFLDDTFVAASSLRIVMPGEKFDLALGADEGIAVKRVLNRHFAEDTGLVSKGRRVTYDYTLTVQNNKKTAEKVVLSDQIPVSRDGKVVVNVRSPEADVAKPESDGTLKWTVNLEPGEKREVPLVFAIEYPIGVRVAGLN
jgi:uncharacterized protein (TIGR02231 family)